LLCISQCVMPQFSIPYLVLISRTDHIQNGQDFLDSLAEMKIPIMTRYEKWRANPSSMEWRAQASNLTSQPLVAHRSVINSVTNASPSVPVSLSSPESPNCPPDSVLRVAASALESSGLTTGYLQMPIQSTWYVGHTLLHALMVLRELNHRSRPEKPNKM
jgi:hypothetical protein